jgi:defect-in-organelle-trafficking protein DotC
MRILLKQNIITLRWVGLVSLFSLFLFGCSGTVRAPNPMNLGAVEPMVITGPQEFENLQVLSRNDELKGAEKMNHIRMDAVRDTAMSLGARTALAWRGEQINRMLNSQADHLNAVFNFGGLILKDNIIPPVLLESRNALSIDSPQNIRVSDRTYQILKQAQFVSAPPTWRDYLVMDQMRPEEPDVSLLPGTDQEKAAWRQGIAQGWEDGLKQADQIYDENLSRLKRDYQGMVRYRMLLAQNMVSAPQVAQRDLGITGGGESLAVNDRILTIKALPSLKADSESWKPSIAP